MYREEDRGSGILAVRDCREMLLEREGEQDAHQSVY